jgi:hypothetical protein
MSVKVHRSTLAVFFDCLFATASMLALKRIQQAARPNNDKPTQQARDQREQQ